jgi:hypothetical protein
MNINVAVLSRSCLDLFLETLTNNLQKALSCVCVCVCVRARACVRACSTAHTHACMPACLCAHPRDCHWMEFHEILYLVLLKSVDHIQV